MMSSLLPTELWDYGLADLMRGLQTSLLSPHRNPRPAILLPGLGPCLPVRSARAAIVVALKALGLPSGARIGVPLYCCPVVFKAIDAAGCRARFIDVDRDTYCLSAADLARKSSEVDAVVAVHMFGNLCDIQGLRDAAPGMPIIEDCAQALGSRLDGRPAGSLGDIAAFSFQSGKYVSAGGGAALHSSQPGLNPRLSKLVADLPSPSRLEESVHVAKTYLRSCLRSRPLWGLIGARLWELYSDRVSYTSQSPLVLAQIYETDRTTTITRLPRLKSWIEKQRFNANYYARNLRVEPEVLCSERPRAFYNRLQYPLLVPTPEQCDRLVRQLQNDGISVGRPYRNIATVAAAHHGYTGDCPQAERIATTVAVIPCNHALRAADVERVADCVNRAWTKIGPRSPAAAVSSVPSRGSHCS